jgi:hypothetical protein
MARKDYRPSATTPWHRAGSLLDRLIDCEPKVRAEAIASQAQSL